MLGVQLAVELEHVPGAKGGSLGCFWLLLLSVPCLLAWQHALLAGGFVADAAPAPAAVAIADLFTAQSSSTVSGQPCRQDVSVCTRVVSNIAGSATSVTFTNFL